jgi:hypothetical protein
MSGSSAFKIQVRLRARRSLGSESALADFRF